MDAAARPVTGAVRATVTYDQMPWIRPLVHAYAADFSGVSALFAGNPADPADWRRIVARVQAATAHRRPIVDVLATQLAGRQAPPAALEAAARLANGQTVAVVTGQQAGAFGGPLYTLLKALSTIRLAHHVEALTGAPVVPVFWVDAEDHDWAEIRSTYLLDRDFSVGSVALPDLPGAGSQPVGRLALDSGISATIAALGAALPPTEYSGWLLDALGRHYRPGVRVTTAFAGLLDELLGPLGLVVFESDDPAAKPLVAGLFAHEVGRPGEMAAQARASGTRMADLGHAAQIVPAVDSVSLFYLDDQGRRSIRYRDGRFRVGDEDRDPAALEHEVRAHPERFSPNVLLRPLVQDTLFPTVGYVAGPSELAYHGQLGEAYAACGIERPLVVSRASATLVDSAAVKFLDRYGLGLDAFAAQDDSILNRLLEAQLPPALEVLCTELDRAIADRGPSLKEVAASVDPTLSGAVDTTVDRMRETLRTLQNKIVQAAKKKDETLRRQFQRTRALVFPAGQPQERCLGVAFFLNRYGSGLPQAILDTLPAVPDHHLLMTP